MNPDEYEERARELMAATPITTLSPQFTVTAIARALRAEAARAWRAAADEFEHRQTTCDEHGAYGQGKEHAYEYAVDWCRDIAATVDLKGLKDRGDA